MRIFFGKIIVNIVIIVLLTINITPINAARISAYEGQVLMEAGQASKEIARLIEIDSSMINKYSNIADTVESPVSEVYDANKTNKSKVIASSYDRIVPYTKVTERIAIIDTGISWGHPSFSSIDAVYWRNMIANSNDVSDYHGHGTQIAGLLASNGIFGTPKGLLPNAKYIILKGLNDKGETEDYILAQSIRTAVDYGAKVIVLSLGISVPSNILKDAVDYAYNKNVLIVAAAGNNTQQSQYPAAYPTVLSVGSVNSAGYRSSFTPSGYELDVLAQGEQVTVLKLGSGTKIAHGTSMAVPLVSAIALNVFHNNSNATVDEVINHINITSKNGLNWSNQQGYGEVNYQDATEANILQTLIRQNNTTPNRALLIPRSGIISTRISNENQYKWYKISAGYEGTVTATYRNKVNKYVRLDVFDENLRLLSTKWLTADKQTTTFRVTAENTLIRISSDASNTPSTASFILDYQIGADIWEQNNSTNFAKSLPLRANTESTLHITSDQDWFYVDVSELGNLRIEVKNVPEHMDSVLMVQYGGFITNVDNNAAGSGETYNKSRLIGRYTFGVRDYNRNIINYPYTIEVSFEPSNASRYSDIQYNWSRSYVEQLYAKSALQEAFKEIRFYPSRYITRAEYASLIVSALKLATPVTNTRAYQDVQINHWGHQAIATAKQYGLIQGYPNNTFRPDMPITRAEIATLTYNAYQSKLYNSASNRFTDVPSNYWANRQISTLARSNILQGYPDGSFQPNHYTSRGEAVAIIARLIQD